MDPLTLKALQTSIRHWTRLATGKYGVRESIYAHDCALCDLFNRSVVDSNCKGCPVSERSGMLHCKNTPWYHVYDILTLVRGNKSSPKFQAAACAELAFLKSLARVLQSSSTSTT